VPPAPENVPLEHFGGVRTRGRIRIQADVRLEQYRVDPTQVRKFIPFEAQDGIEWSKTLGTIFKNVSLKTLKHFVCLFWKFLQNISMMTESQYFSFPTKP
jgi:hypothetical protein